MSRNRNKKNRYRIQTGVPVSEVLLEVEEQDGESVETESNPAPTISADMPALGKADGAAPADPPPDEVSIFVPIVKVDATKHEVWGRLAQEVPDHTNEIMDYASSKPLFSAWSEETYKRSGGKSRGNIRAMHQPVAAGKVIALTFNDGERAIDVGTKIVDENEWQKCLEGVYTGFSIGGKYEKRWMDQTNPSLMRYTARPREGSLVDAPAIPTATFQLVKEDGTVELRKFAAQVPPAEPEVEKQALPGAPAATTTTLVDAKIANLPARPAPVRVDPANPPDGTGLQAISNPDQQALSPSPAEATPEQGVKVQTPVAKAYLPLVLEHAQGLILAGKLDEAQALVTCVLKERTATAKAVQDIPNLRHIEQGDPESCGNCLHFRSFNFDKPYCRKFDSCVQYDWVCDAWEKASADADQTLVPLAASGAATTTPPVPVVIAQAEGAAADAQNKIAKAECSCDCASCKAGDHCGKGACAMKAKTDTPAAADDEKDKALAALAARGKSVGIARRDGEPLTAPKGYPTDWKQYGDPANWGWPVDDERAQSALAYYNGGKGKDKYSAQEWAVLGRRLARLAGAVYGKPYKYDPAKKEVRAAEQETQKMTAPNIAELVGQARTLLSTGTPEAIDQAASILEVALDRAPQETPSTATPPPTPTGTPTGSTLTAAQSPPGKTSPTGDNSPSSATTAPKPSIPTTEKGVADSMTTPTPEPNADLPAVTNPPQAGPEIFPLQGDARIRAKLPEFMNALVNGGPKAIQKAFKVAENDQMFFDELYNAALRKVLDDGKINYDNRELMTKAVLFGTKGMGAGDEDELRKGVTSAFAPGIYLQRLVKLMLPVVTPFRNRVYTEQAPLGAVSAQWRAQLGFANFIYAAAMSVAEAGVTVGSTTGNGQTINESSLTFAAPFASTPNTNVVSLQAVAAGRGFDDPLQIGVIQSLTAMLKTEECNLLYMSNASIAMGAVTAASATGGTIAAGSYNIKVSALTGQGWRYTQDISGYAGASAGYSVGGVLFPTAGETAVTAAGSLFTAGSAKINATWAAVKGAVAYNVYLSDGTNEYYQTTVTAPSVSLSAKATTGSAGPSVNSTANTNGYEGLVSWAELATIYGQAIPSRTFTDQANAALTLNGANSIKEWDAVLKAQWVNWNMAPTLILCSPQSALHANAVITSGSAGFPAYRIEAQNVQGQIVGGLMQTGYINKFAPWAENLPRIVDILAHPYFPDGTYLFLSESINYRMARETRGFKLETRIPYTYFPLGPSAPHYPFTVLVDETLECYHPSAQAALAGVNVS